MICSLSATGSALGQDTITLHGGQTQQVKVIGPVPGGLKVQIGQSTMIAPYANLVSVSMTPPEEFANAIAAAESGDVARAAELDAAVVASYRGLPADWAQQATLMQGDLDLQLGQAGPAALAYKAYHQAYPAAPVEDVSVGLAGIDVATGDYETAKGKIAPILDAALKQPTPTVQQAQLYSRAFFVSGKIKQHAGDLPGALEDYLRSAAVFPQDRIAATGAQAAADELRKEHAGIAVP